MVGGMGWSKAGTPGFVWYKYTNGILQPGIIAGAEPEHIFLYKITADEIWKNNCYDPEKYPPNCFLFEIKYCEQE